MKITDSSGTRRGPLFARLFSTFVPQPSDAPRLDRGWIIANHKLVSFHAAFLTSLLSISASVASRFDVIRQMFLSVEVVISCLMWYAAWHCNIAIHEIGHYLAAVKTNNLGPSCSPCPTKDESGRARPLALVSRNVRRDSLRSLRGGEQRGGTSILLLKRRIWRFPPQAPRRARCLASSAFCRESFSILLGLKISAPAAIYAGRLLFTIGVVALFDF